MKPIISKQCIGLDFDNTIVTYDNVFYKYALKYGLILPEIKRNKQMIRDAIRLLPDGNNKWTRLQGLVYGKYMDEAECMQGVEDFLNACKENSFKIVIVSHKTVFPALGPRINLQVAARQWLKSSNFLVKFGLVENDVVFEETLNGKLKQITNKGCNYFIDDLIEVLVHSEFPKGVKKILYGKRVREDSFKDIIMFEGWNEIKEFFFG